MQAVFHATVSIMNKLERLGIRTDMELVLHLPSRYEDETTLTPIADALFRCEGPVQIEGQIMASDVQYRPKRQLVVSVSDGTGVMHLRFLHFYPSQLKQFSEGKRIRARGELRQGYGGTEMVHPACRIVEEDTPLPTALTPVYPTCAGVSQHYLRKAIAAAQSRLDLVDTLPPSWLDELGLPGFSEALRYLHYPPADADETALLERTHPAWRRMKFDELLAQQLSMRRAQRARRLLKAHAFGAAGHFSRQFMQTLPFTLTKAQLKVVSEIRHDLGRAYPMQRLLQGDVGSGKTLVAAAAIWACIRSGYQAALLAPTEILAAQHAENLNRMLAPFGMRVALLTGGMKAAARRTTLAAIRKDEADLVVGTHALMSEGVEFARLGLAVIDEQHRFGVRQRGALAEKAANPHLLVMSATPIPRTLGLLIYGDLDISILDELPPGRTPVKTRCITGKRRRDLYRFLDSEIDKGRQVYLVCPAIEDVPDGGLNAVKTYYEDIAKTLLPDRRVGLMHGKLKPKEKAAVMEDFKAGRLDALVSTTVIEVGVDVPNASVMVIENAERYGLSALHQLRGRVGRGAAESWCFLVSDNTSEAVQKRLKFLCSTTDGFAVAQYDLETRGPGDFFGSRQHGLPTLQIADLMNDTRTLHAAQSEAIALLAADPLLESPAHALLAAQVQQMFDKAGPMN